MKRCMDCNNKLGRGFAVPCDVEGGHDAELAQVRADRAETMRRFDPEYQRFLAAFRGPRGKMTSR